jgi:hypothetical protein
MSVTYSYNKTNKEPKNPEIAKKLEENSIYAKAHENYFHSHNPYGYFNIPYMHPQMNLFHSSIKIDNKKDAKDKIENISINNSDSFQNQNSSFNYNDNPKFNYFNINKVGLNKDNTYNNNININNNKQINTNLINNNYNNVTATNEKIKNTGIINANNIENNNNNENKKFNSDKNNNSSNNFDENDFIYNHNYNYNSNFVENKEKFNNKDFFRSYYPNYPMNFFYPPYPHFFQNAKGEPNIKQNYSFYPPQMPFGAYNENFYTKQKDEVIENNNNGIDNIPNTNLPIYPFPPANFGYDQFFRPDLQSKEFENSAFGKTIKLNRENEDFKKLKFENNNNNKNHNIVNNNEFKENAKKFLDESLLKTINNYNLINSNELNAIDFNSDYTENAMLEHSNSNNKNNNNHLNYSNIRFIENQNNFNSVRNQKGNSESSANSVYLDLSLRGDNGNKKY